VDSNKYSIAGWLAIISAIIIVPEIVFGVIVERLYSGHPASKIVLAMLHTGGLLISIYILHMFRNLLNERFDFRDVDVLIWILIWSNVLFAGLGIIGLVPGLTRPITFLTLVLFVPFCVITAIFAYKLLQMKEDLYGLLKPFAYTTMAAAICGATIILMPIGLIIQLAALVMQGMIFLRAKEQVEFV